VNGPLEEPMIKQVVADKGFKVSRFWDMPATWADFSRFQNGKKNLMNR